MPPGPADPARACAYFLAVHGIAADETDTVQFDLDLLWKAPAHMRTLLGGGKLVFPLE